LIFDLRSSIFDFRSSIDLRFSIFDLRFLIFDSQFAVPLPMLIHRRILLALSCLVVVGSVGTTGGYAYYLRSAAYRARVARDVGEYLTLPTEIGGVVPLSHRSRGFTNVRLSLPDQPVRIFECMRAVWREQWRDGQTLNFLDLHDGWLLLGSEQMGREDYRQMLRGGLGHDFAALNLAGVDFHNIDIRWRQDRLNLETRGATGSVTFDPDGMGRANLQSRSLNGTVVDEAIAIRATFIPGANLEFRHIALDVPRIPLAALGLSAVLGTERPAGWFDGTVAFRPSDTAQVFTLRGSAGEVRLEDLTERLPTGPIPGGIDVRVREARVTPGMLHAIAFDGRVSGVDVGAAARYFGAADLAGTVDIAVEQCRYAAGRLERLDAGGFAQGIPAAALSDLIGRGRVTGTIRTRISGLRVEADEIRAADITVEVDPPRDAAGLIDRAVILSLAEEALGVDIGRVGNFLPQQVEYARMGCTLRLRDNELRVLGTHGADKRTLLTVRVLGTDVGVLKAPRRTFAVGPLIDRIREQLSGYDLCEYMPRQRPPSQR
jgi:hypothetical protein